MFDSTSFTKDIMSNPTKLAKVVIDAMESSDQGQNLQINDPNNGFVIQTLANAYIFSQFSQKIDHTNNFRYRQRAQSAEQLFAHLSEFDYVKLMASPATLPFLFDMSRDWIIANAVPYDTNYNKIQIPATSYITMGGVVYSMYYPIDIFVNRNTGSVTAFYNSEPDNLLSTLESNMLIDVNSYQRDGIEWFRIVFNMYQFERKVTDYTIGTEQGFSQTIPYTDQFYAVKVFTRDSNNTWKELAYNLTQMYYDTKVPTARLTVMSDVSKLNVTIPQIYFDNGQISQTVRLELYTTKGAVNYTLSMSDVTGLTANFDTRSTPFAAPLDQMPTWSIVPTSVEVAGGSNAMTYDEIRTAIVGHGLHTRAPITSSELKEAARRAGFDEFTRRVDDLTDRMYEAGNVLTDSKGLVVPTLTGSILLADEALEGNPSTIFDYTDEYRTILPTTVFRLANDMATCIPLSDSEIANMAAMPKDRLIRELNLGKFVRQPFHVTLKTTAKSPEAAVYNLLSPEVTSLSFLKENPNSAPQMSMVACAATHQDSGTGGYRLVFTGVRSSNIETADANNFMLIVTAKTKIGETVYLPATHIGVDSLGNDLWEIILSTNYHITTDGYLTVSMYDTTNTLTWVEISLDQTFEMFSTFVLGFDNDVQIDSSLNTQLPGPYAGTQVVMSHQSIKIRLGKDLSHQIYCGVNTTWGRDVYELAEETIYHVTNVPVFQYTSDNILNTRVNPTTQNVEVVIIYNQGDTPSEVADIERTTKASVLEGVETPTFKFDDVTGILVGMKVRGTNIPVGSVVTQIVGKDVTLNLTLDGDVLEGTELVFTNPKLTMVVTEDQDPADLTLITVASTADILVGQSVYGFDVPTGATVVEIFDETTFEISTPSLVEITEDTLLTFINNTNHGTIKVQKGDVVTDANGLPVVISAAKNQYRIPMILFDGRLFASDDPNDRQIVSTIAARLQNYANQISTIDNSFIESSDVYYKPARTMGFARFGLGNNREITLPLTMHFSVTAYVDVAVYNSTTVLDTMSETIISIINAEIQKRTISTSNIAKIISDQLGSNIPDVELRGINDDPDMPLVALLDPGTKPSIENVLRLEADGSITRHPRVDIRYIPKP